MAGIDSISGTTPVQAAKSALPGPVARADAPSPAAGAGVAQGPTAADRQGRELALQQSAGKVRQMLATAAPDLHFSVDKDSGRTVIRVIDPATHEVLRQIPAEEILRMSKNLDEMIARLKGLLIDRLD